LQAGLALEWPPLWGILRETFRPLAGLTQ
jgi:hypothetical protein